MTDLMFSPSNAYQTLTVGVFDPLPQDDIDINISDAFLDQEYNDVQENINKLCTRHERKLTIFESSFRHIFGKENVTAKNRQSTPRTTHKVVDTSKRPVSWSKTSTSSNRNLAQSLFFASRSCDYIPTSLNDELDCGLNYDIPETHVSTDTDFSETLKARKVSFHLDIVYDGYGTPALNQGVADIDNLTDE